jgi:two-component system NtrC family sensor kinase
VLFGLVGSIMAAIRINSTIVKEAQRRVSLDLRAAWSVFNSRLEEEALLVNVLATGHRVAGFYDSQDAGNFGPELEAIRRNGGLDFIGLTDADGRVVLRSLESHTLGDTLENDPFVARALQGETAQGLALLSPERLRAEGGNLIEDAFVVFEKTPKAKPRAKESEASGMALLAAAPVHKRGGEVIGSVFAGILLNRNHEMVDNIRSLVFEDQIYKGRHVGTVTIFQWDVRVATNVVDNDGNRAIGTRVSTSVYDKVLENGQSWYDRAFVVNDWYISAYDPIRDIDDKVIGILYVGVLAEKYDDIRREVWAQYGLATAIAALVVLGVGAIFAQRLTASLHRLAEAAGEVAMGNLQHTVAEPASRDEVRDLTRAFNVMTNNLRDREQRLTAANTKLAKTNTELQQLNANYLDMLGFVSHELKNTLGTVFTAARTMDGGLVGELTDAQRKLVHSIRRSIDYAVLMTRHYLDLAHIEQGELHVDLQPIDLRTEVVEPVIAEVGQNVEESQMVIEDLLPETMPLVGDPTLLRAVYKNLIDNALKYGRKNGTIRLAAGQANGTYELEVWNDGQGVPAERLGSLFDKFVRFAEDKTVARRGTGLGLFITKEIVRKHGGDIRAESAEGEWMRFVFTLPTAPPDVASQSAQV